MTDIAVNYMPQLATNVFRPDTLTRTTLCNEIKMHFDALTIGMAVDNPGWDTVDYTYTTVNGSKKIDKEVYTIGFVTVTVVYTYNTSGRVHKKTVSAVHTQAQEKVPSFNEFTYEYNSDGTVKKISKAHIEGEP